MKKQFITRLNALLTAIIMLLGFGSCRTVKPADDVNQTKQNQQKQDGTDEQTDSVPVVNKDRREYLEPPPVVYGPPPGLFDEVGRRIRK